MHSGGGNAARRGATQRDGLPPAPARKNARGTGGRMYVDARRTTHDARRQDTHENGEPTRIYLHRCGIYTTYIHTCDIGACIYIHTLIHRRFMHTHTHTHTHTFAHAHIHTCIHTYIHACIMHAYIDRYIDTSPAWKGRAVPQRLHSLLFFFCFLLFLRGEFGREVIIKILHLS